MSAKAQAGRDEKLKQSIKFNKYMIIKEQELKEWYIFYKQFKNGYHLSNHDWMEFVRLNHLIMEASHEIHNKNMLKK